MQKWIKELRAGISGYEEIDCCLDVAYRIALDNGVEANIVWTNDVLSWDFIKINPTIANTYLMLVTAIKANDDIGWNFNRIADSIEEYYGLRLEEV